MLQFLKASLWTMLQHFICCYPPVLCWAHLMWLNLHIRLVTNWDVVVFCTHVLVKLYQSCLNFLSFLSIILMCHSVYLWNYLFVPIKSRQMCQWQRRQASAVKCFYVSVSCLTVWLCSGTMPQHSPLYWNTLQALCFLTVSDSADCCEGCV